MQATKRRMAIRARVGAVIRLKASHIAKGRVSSAFSCPIARAINDALGVDNTAVAFTAQIGSRRYKLPLAASRFIDRFDTGEQVKPIRFKLGKEVK
jgi:hypothetical protein